MKYSFDSDNTLFVFDSRTEESTYTWLLVGNPRKRVESSDGKEYLAVMDDFGNLTRIETRSKGYWFGSNKAKDLDFITEGTKPSHEEKNDAHYLIGMMRTLPKSLRGSF